MGILINAQLTSLVMNDGSLTGAALLRRMAISSWGVPINRTRLGRLDSMKIRAAKPQAMKTNQPKK